MDDEQYNISFIDHLQDNLTVEDDELLSCNWPHALKLAKEGLIDTSLILRYKKSYLRLLKSPILTSRSEGWVLDDAVDLGIVKEEEAGVLKEYFLELLGSSDYGVWLDSWRGVCYMIDHKVITAKETKERLPYFTKMIRKLNNSGNLSMVDRNGIDLDMEVLCPLLAVELIYHGVLDKDELKGLFSKRTYWHFPDKFSDSF